MNSALCTGSIKHRRYGPVRHAFRYPLMMLWLDLGNPAQVFQRTPLWSASQPAPARFCREDYLGDSSRPLDACVRDEVDRVLGFRPVGRIFMLTHPRYFGFVFNPLTLYFCFDTEERIIAVVGEVTNTPWNEKHVYVWPAEAVVDRLNAAGHECRKVFHVSPFMAMDQVYRVKIVHRPNGLAVRLESWEAGALVHDATLTLRKRPISASSLHRTLIAYPLMTLRVVARIYIQALRLWLKRAHFFGHPKVT